MIHEFARCPFCQRGVLAIDDYAQAFVFDPDCTNGGPCPHLALATVGFDVEQPDTLELTSSPVGGGRRNLSRRLAGESNRWERFRAPSQLIGTVSEAVKIC